MSLSPYQLMRCPCYAVTEQNIADYIMQFVQADKAGYAVAINAEKIYRFLENETLNTTINGSVFPYPDGAGAVLGLKLLHSAKSEKINMPIRALETANANGLKVFIAGAKAEVHEQGVAVIKDRYPNINVVGHMHGYHSDEEIADAIVAAEPNLVMLALGSPKQEFFAAKLTQRLPRGFIIGCGGALDILAGRLNRAPEFWINNNLEWLYRLQQEPWRWRRQVFLPVFFMKLFGAFIKQKLGVK